MVIANDLQKLVNFNRIFEIDKKKSLPEVIVLTEN